MTNNLPRAITTATLISDELLSAYEALEKAASKAWDFMEDPMNQYHIELAVNLSPAARLRQAADTMERKSTAHHNLRDALAKVRSLTEAK